MKRAAERDVGPFWDPHAICNCVGAILAAQALLVTPSRNPGDCRIALLLPGRKRRRGALS